MTTSLTTLFGTIWRAKPDSIFKHTPLDRSQQSIRLLRVFPSLSSNGLIQCQVSHSTIAATYTCLSYQWGNDSPLYNIELNGEAFGVRANLFNFLVVLQNERSIALSASDAIWIDAACIDQSNVLERNHQVAQMGQIFSNAIRVELWLGGTSPSLAPLIQAIRTGDELPSLEKKALQTYSNLIVKCILNNEYFNRAWVTQEILLARRAVTRIGMESLELEQLIAGLEQFPYPEGPSTFDRSPFAQCTCQRRLHFERESLISLLAQFRDRKCAMLRDRIFSLLSLCADTEPKVHVDYRSPTMDLATNVMQSCVDSLCLCSAILVLQVLDIGQDMQHLGRSSGNAMDTESSNQGEPYLTFDVSMVHSFHGTGKLLYSHQNTHPSSYELYSDLDDLPIRDTFTGRYLPDTPRMCFNIFGTCESASFLNFFATWQSDGYLEGRNMRLWNDEQKRYFPVDSSYAEEFSIERSGRGNNIYTVRISLRLLAKLAPDRVDLCTYATRPQHHSRDALMGTPSIEWTKAHPTLRNFLHSVPPIAPPHYHASEVLKPRRNFGYSIFRKMFVCLGIRYITRKTREHVFRQRRNTLAT